MKKELMPESKNRETSPSILACVFHSKKVLGWLKSLYPESRGSWVVTPASAIWTMKVGMTKSLPL
jgi:hypothetical protein